MKYQVGLLTLFEKDDPTFDTLVEAMEYAFEKTEGLSYDIYGVWTSQGDGSELITIIYQCEAFRK